MNATFRLWISAIIATLFYGAWSLFANALVTQDIVILIRSALVQGFYSGLITFLFTWMLEKTYKSVGVKHLSFAFVVPLVCMAHHQTKHANIIRSAFNRTLDKSAMWLKGVCWPAAVVAPLVPLSIQSVLVIAVNLVNQTPNLVMTVAPSIMFSALYGYTYTLTLYKQHKKMASEQAQPATFS